MHGPERALSLRPPTALRGHFVRASAYSLSAPTCYAEFSTRGEAPLESLIKQGLRLSSALASLRGSGGGDGAGRVLVVEDDQDMRNLIRDVLAAEGCDARTAENGEVALVMLSDWSPDVILLDLRMPVMGGAAFASAYHQRPGPHAPIVVLSGSELAEEDVVRIGARAFLREPFGIEELLSVVSRFTDCVDESEPTAEGHS